MRICRYATYSMKGNGCKVVTCLCDACQINEIIVRRI